MRLFLPDSVKMMFASMSLPDDQPISAKLLSNSIEKAQKNIESAHYGQRKHTLQFDDVMNSQREIIYGERNKVLEGIDMHETVENMIKDTVENAVMMYMHGEETEEDRKALENYIMQIFDIEYKIEDKKQNKVTEEVKELALKKFAEKEEEFGEEQFRKFERYVILRTVDDKWMEHLETMEQLKASVNLRAYGQKDPVTEYRMESYDIFNEMSEKIKENVTRVVLHQSKVTEEQTNTANLAKATEMIRKMIAARNAQAQNQANTSGNSRQPVVNSSKKVGRNEPCPCGSGKKYKKCCGANEQ